MSSSMNPTDNTSTNELVEIIQRHRPETLVIVSLDQAIDHEDMVIHLGGFGQWSGTVPDDAVTVQTGIDTEILLRWRAGLVADTEPMIIGAAWQLGAMDLHRLVCGPLANMNDVMQPGNRITDAFSARRYHLPFSMGDVKITPRLFDETPNRDLCEHAARYGRIHWTFNPMAGNQQHYLWDSWLTLVPNIDPDGWRRRPSGIARLPLDVPVVGQYAETTYKFVDD